MTPSGEGSSTGETGVTSPAGNPTNENQQPGMSPQNPTDPRPATIRMRECLRLRQERQPRLRKRHLAYSNNPRSHLNAIRSRAELGTLSPSGG
jgi:hypothetical protein